MIKLLLIEDSQFARIFYGERLKRSNPNLDFHAAPNMGKALELIRDGFSPDVVIADLVLGDSSSSETINQFPEFIKKGARVLAMSVEQEYKQAALDGGASDFYLKGTGAPLTELNDKVVALVKN